MAMLDPRMFDPATFSPFMPQMPNFGLLNIPQSAGFPAVPEAEDLSAKTAQQPGAPLSLAPPNPTPVQESPGFFGSLSNGLANNSNTLLAIGAGLLSDGYAGGLKGAMVGGKLDRDQKNQSLTEQALTARGLTPEMARIVASNPALLQGVLQDSLGIKAKTDDIKEYEYAKQQGFKGSLSDWMAHKRAGAGEFGLQPIYGTGPDGKPVILQLGKSGTAIQSKVPEGVNISTGVEKIDMGTQYALQDKRSGQIVGYLPKDVRGAASEKAIGTAQGTVRASLPTDILSAEQTTKQIDQLLESKGLDSIVGPLDQFRPSWLLDSDGRDALARYNQLKGKAFLQAYTMLKGGGQITEVEGTKAENAMARMDRAQSEEEFKTALKDFRDAVRDGVQKMKEKAGLAPDAAPPATVVSGASDLKKKYGLD